MRKVFPSFGREAFEPDVENGSWGEKKEHFCLSLDMNEESFSEMLVEIRHLL
jgi:hypothetical protein